MVPVSVHATRSNPCQPALLLIASGRADDTTGHRGPVGPTAPYARPMRGERQHRHLVVAAGFLAVVVAVLSDLVAGEAALHTATLGLVTGATAILRVRMAGRARGLLRFLSACVVAQPALHAAAKLVPHAPLDHGVGRNIGLADIAVTGTQLVVAVLIVAVVSCAEQIATLISGVIRVSRLWIRLEAPYSDEVAHTVRRTPVRAQLWSRYQPIAMRKRGPPRVSLSAV